MKKLILTVAVTGLAFAGCKKEEKPKLEPKPETKTEAKVEIKKPEQKPEIKKEPEKPKVDPTQAKIQELKSAIEKLETDLAAKKKEYGDIKGQRDPYKKALFMLSKGKLKKADAIPELQKKVQDLYKQLADLKNKGAAKKEEMKTAFKNIDRAANKIMKKRSTKERIGWYYVNVPNKIYPMSQLHKGRTSRVRYVYKEDKRSQEAKAKAQQKYDQIKKEYEALGKQFKEAKNQYDAALAEYKKQCECKCEECTGKMNAIKEEGKNLEKSIEESKKELSSLTEV